jgi:hypothetical protein
VLGKYWSEKLQPQIIWFIMSRDSTSHGLMTCLKLLEQGKQAKCKWLQNQSHTNGNDLNNIRREINRTFRNKKGGGDI